MFKDVFSSLFADGEAHHRRRISDALAIHFNLTSEELAERLPSGRTKFLNRFSPALTYSRSAGLVESSRLGYWKLTERGFEVSRGNPQTRSDSCIPDTCHEELTPAEAVEENYQRGKEELAERLLQRVMSCTPTFFERLVIDLLVGMGYGGSWGDAEAIGRSGDGGIDGIINEDRLGLDVIYVQARRWQSNIGSPHIASFAGALAGRNASKGIYITTSDFTRAAREFEAPGLKIVLIDGDQLVELMIEHNIGVSKTKTYEIKRVNSDYFAENSENS